MRVNFFPSSTNLLLKSNTEVIVDNNGEDPTQIDSMPNFVKKAVSTTRLAEPTGHTVQLDTANVNKILHCDYTGLTLIGFYK